MVRCAMCFEEADTLFYVKEQGNLNVCWYHHGVLNKNKFRDILKKLIHKLNKHYTKIPLVQAPTRKFENNGRRWGLKTAITEIEEELEGLLK